MNSIPSHPFQPPSPLSHTSTLLEFQNLLYYSQSFVMVMLSFLSRFPKHCFFFFNFVLYAFIAPLHCHAFSELCALHPPSIVRCFSHFGPVDRLVFHCFNSSFSSCLSAHSDERSVMMPGIFYSLAQSGVLDVLSSLNWLVLVLMAVANS